MWRYNVGLSLAERWAGDSPEIGPQVAPHPSPQAICTLILLRSSHPQKPRPLISSIALPNSTPRPHSRTAVDWIYTVVLREWTCRERRDETKSGRTNLS